MLIANFATQLFNGFGNKDRFILLIIGPIVNNLFPVFILGPRFFGRRFRLFLITSLAAWRMVLVER